LTNPAIFAKLTYMNPTETLTPRTDKRNAAFAPYFRAIKTERAEGVNEDREAVLTIRHHVLSSRYRQNVPPKIVNEAVLARIAYILLG
jgi:hypothetical protein